MNQEAITRKDGVIGLIRTPKIRSGYEDASYADEVAGLDTPSDIGYRLFKDPITGKCLIVIDDIRVRNNLVVKTEVYQQARGISGNLFLSPVAKIKAIVNKITPVIGDNES